MLDEFIDLMVGLFYGSVVVLILTVCYAILFIWR